MIVDIVELERYLNRSDIPEQHKDTIKVLINFYNHKKRPDLEKVIDDLKQIIGEDGMFIGAESSAGYENDPYVTKVQKRVKQLLDIQQQLENIKNEWGF